MSTTAEGADSAPIVHVVALTGAGGQFGGPTTVAVETVRELSRRGRPVVLASLDQGATARPAGIATEAWLTFPARRLVPRTGMLGLFNPALAWRLWRLLRPGVVLHLHAGRDLVSLTALVLAAVRRTPVVAQTHGMVQPRSAPVTRAFDLLFLALLRRARVVLYLTEDERQDLRRQLGPRARLRAVRNGVELPVAAARPSGRPVVLFAGRLHPVKQVLVFAEAAAVARDAGVEADWVVHGPDQGDLPALLDFIAERGLQGRLDYRGALDHPATLRALARASVFVLPSRVDWMPMSLLEAMAAGVPTVSTWGSGLARTVADADAGLVVDGSVAEVATAVRRLLDEPGLAADLAANARRLVAEEFTIERVVDDLEEVYAGARRPEATRSTTRSRPL